MSGVWVKLNDIRVRVDQGDGDFWSVSRALSALYQGQAVEDEVEDEYEDDHDEYYEQHCAQQEQQALDEDALDEWEHARRERLAERNEY